MSTHLIKVPGVLRLKRWGLLDEVVRAANCPQISKVTFDLGAFSLTGSAPSADGTAECYAPRCIQLDKILVEAAVEAGVELREGFRVREILMDNAQVTGVSGREVDGEIVTEKARIVVGADGLNSTVAQAVQAPAYHRKPTLTCACYAYWSGVALDGLHICPREGRMTIAFPTNDTLACVYVAWPKQEFRAFRSDIENSYLKTVELVPKLAERVRAGKREERFVGTAVLPNFFCKPDGPGWALVGDAGYHKDPVTAQGITDAFRDAELLAEAIDAGFSGQRPLEEALAGYERQRNQAAMPMFDNTCRRATLAPPTSEMWKLLAALRGNQKETDNFLGTIQGTVSIREFFAPENVQRIISAA
jgi:flavin-dependent dehydrogenase